MFFQNNKGLPTKQHSDMTYIMNHTTFDWAKGFLTGLKNSRKNVSARQSVDFEFMHHGLGDKNKIVAFKRNFKSLDEEFLLDAIKSSENCAFFIDVEGTLCETCPFSNTSDNEGPLQGVIQALNNIAKKSKFSIYIVTGRKRHVLERWFAEAPKVGLVAEFGSYIRHSDCDTWEVVYGEDSNWRETAVPIIQDYVERTDGSILEEKYQSVVFQYRESDPDFGALQAKELITHLEIVLLPYISTVSGGLHHMQECEVTSGFGFVEVKPKGLNKGTAIIQLLRHIESTKGPVDMVFAAGDDVADEEMFRTLHSLKTEQNSMTVDRDRLVEISCSIGQKPSEANYFLSDYESFILLLKIVENFVEAKRHLSIPRSSPKRLNLLSPSNILEDDRTEEEDLNFDKLGNVRENFDLLRRRSN